MKGYPVIDGVVNTNGVSFARFFDTSCNYRISAIGNNPLSPDAVHPVHMTGTNKLNVELNSLVFFYEPDLEWITQEVWLQCDNRMQVVWLCGTILTTPFWIRLVQLSRLTTFQGWICAFYSIYFCNTHLG